MKRIILCPNCGSWNVCHLSLSQKAGIAIGGLIGSILGCFVKDEAKKKSILGGFFIGSAIGNRIGKHLDRHVWGEYKCNVCGKIFTSTH